MKIRNGFVSNSSSSSFIIAYKVDKCPHCGRSDDLEFHIKNSENIHSNDTEIYASGKKDVVEYIENCGWTSLQEKVSLEDIKKLNEDIWKIMFFNVDYDYVDSLTSILSKMKNNGNLIVIFDEENRLGEETEWKG